MSINSLNRWISCVILAGALQGGAAVAQTSPTAWSAGYSSYKLYPTHGVAQQLNGFAVGGERQITPGLSLEAAISQQTGTQSDGLTGGNIDMRQVGGLGGVKASVSVNARWQWFAHFLVGVEHLKASEGSSSDQKNSLAYGPGLGVDLACTDHLSLRAQEDIVLTRYSGAGQTGANLTVGLVFRP